MIHESKWSWNLEEATIPYTRQGKAKTHDIIWNDQIEAQNQELSATKTQQIIQLKKQS